MILLFAVAGATLYNMTSGGFTPSIGLIIGALIVTLIVGIAGAFLPKMAMVLGPIYAVVEGFLLGVISAFAMTKDGGDVVVIAVLVTASIFFALLILYRMRVIKVSAKFVSVIVTATFGAFIFYLIIIALQLVGVDTSFMHDGSPLAICLGLILLFIASSNLLVDFYSIDRGIEQGVSKEYEWYFAFSLMVSIAWVYLEVLRLIQNFNK